VQDGRLDKKPVGRFTTVMEERIVAFFALKFATKSISMSIPCDAQPLFSFVLIYLINLPLVVDPESPLSTTTRLTADPFKAYPG
jgi:hypothetical protein